MNEMTLVETSASSEPKQSSAKGPVLRNAILQTRGLTKRFGKTEVLKGIDLDVHPQELLFIIGPSGSGKSTLLRCCNRLEEPDGGHVVVDGVNLMDHGVNINKVRQHIGMVFQSFNLYPHMNARRNVSLALRKVLGLTRSQADERANASLAQVGLADFCDSHPGELSGGQQQRVAIARCLALQPKIVLFDEPTSALDPELVSSVLKVMRDLKQHGMTMVVVSHEMKFAHEAADRVLFMDEGRIVEEASPAQMFSSPRHQRTREFLAQVQLAV